MPNDSTTVWNEANSWMKWLIPALGGSGGGLAGLPTNSTTTSNSTTNRTGTQTGAETNYQYGTSTVNPNLNPQAQALLDALLPAYLGNLASSTDLRGYASSGIDQINRNSEIAKMAAGNALAARGLTYSPAAGVVDASGEISRVGQVSSFLNSVPMLQRQLLQTSLDSAGNFFRSIPYGQTQTSSQEGGQNSVSTMNATDTTNATTSTRTNPGGGFWGGLLGGLGGTLLKMFVPIPK